MSQRSYCQNDYLKPTRNGGAALKFLEDYLGFAQCDDDIGNDYLGNKKTIVILGCWAHARHKFFDVVKVRKSIAAIEAIPKARPIKPWSTSASCT